MISPFGDDSNRLTVAGSALKFLRTSDHSNLSCQRVFEVRRLSGRLGWSLLGIIAMRTVSVALGTPMPALQTRCALEKRVSNSRRQRDSTGFKSRAFEHAHQSVHNRTVMTASSIASASLFQTTFRSPGKVSATPARPASRAHRPVGARSTDREIARHGRKPKGQEQHALTPLRQKMEKQQHDQSNEGE